MDLDSLLSWNSSLASRLFYFCLYFIRSDLNYKCPAAWLGGSNCSSPVVSLFKPSVLSFYSFLKKKCFVVCDQISSLSCVVFGLEPKTIKELFLCSPSMLFSSCCLKEKRSQIACKCQNENFFGLVHWFCTSWSFFGLGEASGPELVQKKSESPWLLERRVVCPAGCPQLPLLLTVSLSTVCCSL